MKKLLFICVLLLVGVCVLQAVEYIDVLYLTDGSIIKGTIIEQVPGEQVKIQTRDGSILVHSWDKIEKFAREVVTPSDED
jgi:hypothetical protein